MVTIMGVAAPGSLILTAGHQSQVNLHLLLLLSGQPALGPQPSPRPWVHGSRPGAITTAPAVGNLRPSAPTPTPMPLTGTAASGTGPAAGPGDWSRDRAAAASAEHGAGHSFLRPLLAAAPGPRSASPLPIAPPVITNRLAPAEPPPLPGQSQGTAASRPPTRRRRPGYTSPSSGPWRQTRRRDSYPPGINMPRPEIFSKNHSRGITPRMGPRGKNFKPI
jgi:hypothetical protein